MTARSLKPASTWKLQDAKARFSEVVRKAKSEGPQHVTVHGRDEAVILSVDAYLELVQPEKPYQTGQAIIDAFSKLRGLNIERHSVLSPIRATPNFDEDT